MRWSNVARIIAALPGIELQGGWRKSQAQQVTVDPVPLITCGGELFVYLRYGPVSPRQDTGQQESSDSRLGNEEP